MIGKGISPVLAEIEDALWDHEFNVQTPPGFTDAGFRAATKIFMAAVMDRMWQLQSAEGMDIETRKSMAQKAGEDVRELVKVYTNVDTTKLY